MKAINHASLWRDLRSILVRSLEIESNRIGVEQTDIVADFLDNNEFGLARDQLLDALSDLELMPLETTQLLLTKATKLMDAPR